jgi:hypothetical protein
VSAQSADGASSGDGRRRSYSVRSAAPCQHPDQRGPELAIGSKPDAPSGGQVIPAAGSVTSTTQQPVLLTLTQRAMQDRLPGGLTLQDADLAGGPSRPKRAAVHRIQYRELNLPERIAGLHSSSLGPPGAAALPPGAQHRHCRLLVCRHSGPLAADARPDVEAGRAGACARDGRGATVSPRSKKQASRPLTSR